MTLSDPAASDVVAPAGKKEQAAPRVPGGTVARAKEDIATIKGQHR
jgi:hypothetical protein